jgi:demethylmenaquinone methyltransferase/2-methoxy-6-polyprenyl-1,4-benzoquinol methylase
MTMATIDLGERDSTGDQVAGRTYPVYALDVRRYTPDLTRQGFTSVEFHSIR